MESEQNGLMCNDSKVLIINDSVPVETHPAVEETSTIGTA